MVVCATRHAATGERWRNEKEPDTVADLRDSVSRTASEVAMLRRSTFSFLLVPRPQFALAIALMTMVLAACDGASTGGVEPDSEPTVGEPDGSEPETPEPDGSEPDAPEPDVGPGVSCEEGLTSCDDSCVDTSTDLQNCQGCGIACDAGEVCGEQGCEAGADCNEVGCEGLSYCDLATGNCLYGCTSDGQCSTNEECDITSNDCVCVSGTHSCSGSCVSNSSVATCGDRCTPCPEPANSDAVCSQGSCDFQCHDGYRECGGACSACPTDASSTTCDGSQCVASACSGGLLACDGACLDCGSDSSVDQWGCSAQGTCEVSRCADGYAPCASGCCTWSSDVVTTLGQEANYDMDIDSSGRAHFVVTDADDVYYGTDDDYALSLVPFSFNSDPEFYTYNDDEETQVTVKAGTTRSYLVRTYSYTHRFTQPNPGSRRYNSYRVYSKTSSGSWDAIESVSAQGARDFSTARNTSNLYFSAAQNSFGDWRIWMQKFTGASEDDWGYLAEGANPDQTVSVAHGGDHRVFFSAGSAIYYAANSFDYALAHTAEGAPEDLSAVVVDGKIRVAWSTWNDGVFVLTKDGDTYSAQRVGDGDGAFAVLSPEGQMQVISTVGSDVVLYTDQGSSWTQTTLLAGLQGDLRDADRDGDGKFHLLVTSSGQLLHRTFDAFSDETPPPPGPEPEPEPEPTGMCTNTCQYANDGECDDGGPNSDYSVCDLGTDCGDCGER